MTPYTSNPKILLVDDDLNIRELVASFLLLEGYTVIEADSGQSALTHFHENSEIDLIISDFQMPEGDGLWLATQIRSMGSQTPFILMTGNTDWTLEKALEQGMNGLYHKPLPAGALTSLLQSIRTFLRT